MKDELKSMKHNKIWDCVKLHGGCKIVGCKWFFKIKQDISDEIERHKARLVAKSFT